MSVTVGNRRWLESISKSLFEPGTQIELIRSDKIVRIVAPKVTAELILQEINTLLDQAQTRVLGAAQISPKKLDQSILDEVGQITHSVVRYDKSGKDIEVSWITPPEGQREGLEDLADVAYRLLYSAYGYKQAGDATMEVQPEPYEVGGWYLPDYHSQGKMAWKDRLSKWARWAIATPRRGARPADPIKLSANDNLYRNLDDTPSLSFASDGWSVEPQVTTKAVFGRVLHREPAPSNVEAAYADGTVEDDVLPKDGSHDWHTPYNRNTGIDDKLDRHLDRILSPVIPPLKSLAALTAKNRATTTQTSILLRFLPAPSNTSFPSLELTLLMDLDTDNLTPHSLRAVSRVATHDILLPSHPVDIRLTNTTSHLLPGSSLPSSCPELTTFLASSDLRPHEGILSTPSRPPPIRLPSRISRSSPLSPSDAETTEEASYIFAGLELHRRVETSVQGWRLSYTSVEAGQGGGHRAELALESARAEDGGLDEKAMPGGEFEERFEPGVKEVDGKGGKMGAEEYVRTLSRLVLGEELRWFGEMPDEGDGEGEAVDGGSQGLSGDGEV